MVHYVNGHIQFYFPLGGFCSGVFIGFVVSRMSKITWDHNGEVIITKLDWIGLAIFLVYVSFIAFKNTIIEDIVHLHNISSISLAVLSGTMLGHALTLRKRIIKFYLKSRTVE
jgi:protein-S-isoprenylcysteine O-methyltransferase Ste14